MEAVPFFDRLNFDDPNNDKSEIDQSGGWQDKLIVM